ncbi:MAG: hypothetical protein IT306_16505 [Chloroflexi bacterium]|nr:hypothetical protein [Chloroflexota bacterium]
MLPILRSKLAFTAAGFLAGVSMTVATLGGIAAPVAADEADNAFAVAQKAGVSASTFQLDKSGLHDIDVAANEGRLLPGALGNVRRARIAVQATAWPEALQPMAAENVEALKALEEAIRSEDPAKVAGPAKAAHDKGHDLSAAVYGWLDTGAAPADGHGH